MNSYIQYMSSKELKERRRELEGYISSGYTFLYDDSIVQYDRTVISDFEEEIQEINNELEARIGRTLSKLAL